MPRYVKAHLPKLGKSYPRMCIPNILQMALLFFKPICSHPYKLKLTQIAQHTKIGAILSKDVCSQYLANAPTLIYTLTILPCKCPNSHLYIYHSPNGSSMHQSSVSKREVDNYPMWILTSTLQDPLFMKKRRQHLMNSMITRNN